MDDVWETKGGWRRVRHDPPTVDEAVVAAQGLTDNLDEQASIVVSLMAVTFEEARGAVLRMGQGKSADRVTITARPSRGGLAAPARAVVVERRGHRHVAVQQRRGDR